MTIPESFGTAVAGSRADCTLNDMRESWVSGSAVDARAYLDSKQVEECAVAGANSRQWGEGDKQKTQTIREDHPGFCFFNLAGEPALPK